MGSSEEEYAAFEEKVKRTVYFDNLSPQVTESVMRTALDQFAAVKSIKFIPNYLGPSNLPQCALVELDSAKKVKEVVSMIGQYPFMISGMPRPVRARPAVVEMFDDPIKPKKKIRCCWLEPSDPDFEAAKELKHLTRKHAAEVAFMHKVRIKLVRPAGFDTMGSALNMEERLEALGKEMDNVRLTLTDMLHEHKKNHERMVALIMKNLGQKKHAGEKILERDERQQATPKKESQKVENHSPPEDDLKKEFHQAVQKVEKMSGEQRTIGEEERGRGQIYGKAKTINGSSGEDGSKCGGFRKASNLKLYVVATMEVQTACRSTIAPPPPPKPANADLQAKVPPPPKPLDTGLLPVTFARLVPPPKPPDPVAPNPQMAKGLLSPWEPADPWEPPNEALLATVPPPPEPPDLSASLDENALSIARPPLREPSVPPDSRFARKEEIQTMGKSATKECMGQRKKKQAVWAEHPPSPPPEPPDRGASVVDRFLFPVTGKRNMAGREKEAGVEWRIQNLGQFFDLMGQAQSSLINEFMGLTPAVRHSKARWCICPSFSMTATSKGDSQPHDPNRSSISQSQPLNKCAIRVSLYSPRPKSHAPRVQPFASLAHHYNEWFQSETPFSVSCMPFSASLELKLVQVLNKPPLLSLEPPDLGSPAKALPEPKPPDPNASRFEDGLLTDLPLSDPSNTTGAIDAAVTTRGWLSLRSQSYRNIEEAGFRNGDSSTKRGTEREVRRVGQFFNLMDQAHYLINSNNGKGFYFKSSGQRTHDNSRFLEWNLIFLRVGAWLSRKEIDVIGVPIHFVSSDKIFELKKLWISLNSGDENDVRPVFEEFTYEIKLHEERTINKKTIIDEKSLLCVANFGWNNPLVDGMIQVSKSSRMSVANIIVNLLGMLSGYIELKELSLLNLVKLAGILANKGVVDAHGAWPLCFKLWDPGRSCFQPLQDPGAIRARQLLIQWKDLQVEDAIWEDGVYLESQFTKLRLEDKSVFQEGGNVRTPNENVGPSRQLTSQLPKPIMRGVMLGKERERMWGKSVIRGGEERERGSFSIFSVSNLLG